MKRSLTRDERLRSDRCIKSVFVSGKVLRGRGMQLRYVANNLNHNRYLVVTERKFGTAVRRNKARRVAKELFRTSKPEQTQGFDLALIVFRGDYTFSERSRQFRVLLGKAGVL